MSRAASRRHFLSGAVATLATACASRSNAPAEAALGGQASAFALQQIERTTGGRLGVFALDTHTGRDLAQRADERFAMCSTFKWLLAAQVLARVDSMQLSLGEYISYGSRDLLEQAPVAR